MRTVFSVLSLAFLSACLFAFEPAGTRANHSGGMNVMAIDMEEEATPANTSTALGTRELCRRIDENNVLDADEDVVDGLFIDITARDVPPYDDNGTPGNPLDDTGGILAYQFDLNYSVSNLTVQAHQFNSAAVNLLQSNAGSALIDASDSVPDDNVDGKWYAGVLDGNSPPSVPEEGSGVLSRLTLTSEVGAVSGLYLLTLSNNIHVDTPGNGFVPDATNSAYVAINAPCGDFDADGIPDDQDACYTMPGVPATSGCPAPTTPRPPAVGGSAGLVTDTSNVDDGPSMSGPMAIVATAAIISVAGGVLVRQLVARRARR